MIYFFFGKGGVGKTTNAAINALQLSKSCKVLIVSADPAHNLGDVFDIKLEHKPIRIAENLDACEINYKKVVDEYLKRITAKIKREYKYLAAFNLDGSLNVLRFSPGVEEDALLRAIWKLVNIDVYDDVIIDLPPTGLALRIMALPVINRVWLNKLLKARKKIVDIRESLENMKPVFLDKSSKDKNHTDKVYNELEKIEKENMMIYNRFADPEFSSIFIVMNIDKLSYAETIRTLEGLKELKISAKTIIVNRYTDSDANSCPDIMHDIKRSFSKYSIKALPYREHGIIGIEQLNSAEYFSM